MLGLIGPLLCEMEELGQDLNKEEFVEAACRLYETLAPPDKNLLINYRRVPKKRDVSEPRFQVTNASVSDPLAIALH